jgi:hypothetical protein
MAIAGGEILAFTHVRKFVAKLHLYNRKIKNSLTPCFLERWKAECPL